MRQEAPSNSDVRRGRRRSDRRGGGVRRYVSRLYFFFAFLGWAMFLSLGAFFSLVIPRKKSRND
jgi:hypothetical protein